MQNTRKLKVHTKYRAKTFGSTTIPEIRLEGKWLHDLGFKQGDTVLIHQEQNKLTITIEPQQK